MDSRGLMVVRIGLLVIILGFFAGSLGYGVWTERAAGDLGALPRGNGTDPGLRVRLWNDRELMGEAAAPPRPLPDFEELRIGVIAPALIWSPDDGQEPPNERVRRLAPGSQVRILPSVEGLIVSSKQIDGGKDLVWEVARVRIQPLIDGQDPGRPALVDPLRFERPDRSPWLAVGQHRFRGSIDVVKTGPRALMAVNQLPVEAYLEGVVAREMGAQYPLEALKAQAIAARGVAFVKSRLAQAAQREYDLVNTVDDQRYLGQGVGTEVVRRAVAETRGVVMLARGNPFEPRYHASSGGFTASVDDIAPGARDARGQWQLAQTAMTARPDPAWQPAVAATGRENTHGTTTVVLKGAQIREALAPLFAPAGRVIGHIRYIRVEQRDPVSDRVETLVIGHAPQDELTISAHAFRMALGPEVLRSTLWSRDSPRREPGPGGAIQWVFTCSGWGHGVGMSQISAGWLAGQGRTASNILLRFYGPDVNLWQLW